ncbi:MAG: hypothetical protein NVS4B7_18440 [Ktedonobacteraceae bacterium]
MRRPRVKDTIMLSGWLFADLLLALAILFLAANTVGAKPQPIPTPTPVPTLAPTATFTPTFTPTPTQEPRLDFSPQRITLTGIDYQGLLNNSQSAANDVKQKLRGQSVLQGRSVGLTIVYDGAPTDGDIQQADSVDGKIYNVLKGLGKEGFAFQRSSYYDNDPLYTLGNTPDIVTIDVFLFRQ